jgi:2,6-dihydroxypyridine 3-monooxygenase
VKPPRVLIAGGSIGGLTAGLLLAELGYDVQIFERSSAALQERGTGIVVLPITERYFTEKGGTDDRPSLELTDWSYIDRSGTITHAEADHFRFSGWNTVYRAMLEVFPTDRYHLDSEMVGFDRRSDGVTLHLADGRSVEGDLLVCSDGIASTARRILLPECRPEYAGYVAWRGITDERHLRPETLETVRDAMLYQILDHSHILVYAIPDHEGDTTPGRRIINSVWYRNYPDEGEGFGSFTDLMTGTDGQRRTTTMPPGLLRPEYVDEMLATAEETLAPQLAEIVRKCPAPMVQAIYDLEVPQMAFGRVIIMGDAAFGLRPHVAAGQAKACADAWALREAMACHDGDIDRALADWEPRQLALGRMAVEKTRDMGIRSQFQGAMMPGDPDWKFGLWEPGN